MSKVYVGDVGTLIRVDTGSVLTGATTRAILVRKPNGQSVSWAATISTSDPKVLEYTVTAGDFDVPGDYLFQASVSISGWQGLGETAKLTVYRAFN